MIGWAPHGLLTTPISFGLRKVETFDGKRVVVLEGDGENGSPYREVTYWLDEHDHLIARFDPTDEIDTACGPSDSFQESRSE